MVAALVIINRTNNMPKPSERFGGIEFYKNGERNILLLTQITQDSQKTDVFTPALVNAYYQRGFSVYVANSSNITDILYILGLRENIGVVCVGMQITDNLLPDAVDMLILVNCDAPDASYESIPTFKGSSISECLDFTANVYDLKPFIDLSETRLWLFLSILIITYAFSPRGGKHV